MKLSNLEHLPNHIITERLDIVYGSTVRSKHVGKDLFAGLKNIVGGELTAYTELLEESREEAVQRMTDKARRMGADAIVGVRFSTSNIAQGASELFVYGTAVKVQEVGSAGIPHAQIQPQIQTQTQPQLQTAHQNQFQPQPIQEQSQPSTQPTEPPQSPQPTQSLPTQSRAETPQSHMEWPAQHRSDVPKRRAYRDHE